MKLKQNFVCCRYDFCKLAKISSLLLAIIGILFVFQPVSRYSNDANAADGENYLEVSISPEVKIDIMAGEMSVAKDTVTVSTGSESGYKLFLSTKSSTTNTISNGANQNSNIFATSGTFGEPAVIKNEEGSVWGCALAGFENFDDSYDINNPSETAKFAAVPTSGNDQLIKDQTSSISNDVTEIYYGIKTNIEIKTGEYSADILYTVIADVANMIGDEIGAITPEVIFEDYGEEYVEIQTSLATNMENLGEITATIDNVNCDSIEVVSQAPVTIKCKVPSGLTFGKKDIKVSLQKFDKTYEKAGALNIKQIMQRIDAERCRSLTLNEQYEAKDARDGTIYYIAKLIDGNCWMTQNLDLELSAEQALTSNDTDLNVLGTGYAQDGDVISWTPTNTTYTGTKLTTTTIPASADVPVSWNPGEFEITGGKGTSACTKADFSTCAAATKVAASTTELKEANHYKVGNYYNWPAATASNKSTTDTPSAALAVAQNSICPKGWSLPRNQTSTITAGTDSIDAGLFANLLYAQGIVGTNTATTYTTDGATNVVLDPLYIVFSGSVSDQTISHVGDTGQFWTSTLSDSNTAYGAHVGIGLSTISLNAQHHRKVLHNIRCVVRSEDTLTYDGQGGNNVPATETKNTSAENGSTFVIPNQRPSKAGSVFLGWDEDPNAAEPTYKYNTATEVFDTNMITTRTTTLYAIWSSCNPAATTINDAVCMQDMNDDVKSSMVTDQQYELMDSRDGKLYYIAKLIDNNVWMTQNLDTSLSANNPLTSENTDINVAFSSVGYAVDGDVISWTPSKETNNGTFARSNTAWKQNDANIENVWNPGDFYITDGGLGSTAACTSGNLASCATKTNVVSVEPENGGRHYHVGNYYNWAAAVLTSKASTDYPSASSTNYTVVQNSICPKGWKLPEAPLNSSTNGVYGNYLQMRGIISTTYTGTSTVAVTAANTKPLFGAPSYIVATGSVGRYTTSSSSTTNAAPANIGLQARYWTASINSNALSYSFRYNRDATTIYPQGTGYRQEGFTIRCIAR